MSGDFSRIGFDPSLDDFGVLWQQGRPVTDRDCNDLVLQVVRRTHAGMLDTVGPEAVPEQTADAFKIAGSGGSLTIERGRMYVDGLLAENHGAAPQGGALSWDPHLAELFGSAPLDYATQPYDPNPPALPTTAGSHLVYLDVWQREVSHHMRDGLVDSAIGVDTTARLQTVWQVKVHPDAGVADCDTPLDQLFPSSAGRLTSDTAQVPGQPDPCEIPPAAGYKGQENQLYRVEIHKGGGLGTATFKWSRDNANVETRVTAIIGLTQLVVESVGKDDVLRLSDGDWIEITDDWLELHNEPGLLRRIKVGGGVDDVSRTITLDNALPVGTFPVNAQNLTEPTRHTRIRRWDQKKTIFDAAGTQIQDLDAGTPPSGEDGILVPAAAGTQVLLEAGVVVSFTLQPTSGEFHSGDWWVFAARAGDTSIEELQEEAPRGIHHHYAHLALWDPSTGAVTDCRLHWPPKGGCCTVNVAPGESIQAAIDSLPPEGGCVCLKTGLHEINDPIEIFGSRIILHGESPGTIVRSQGPTLLLIGDKQTAVLDVTVMDIRFEAGVAAPPLFAPIVQASICRRLRIEGCQLTCIAPVPAVQAGAILWDMESLAFRGNRVEKLAFGLLIDEYAEAIEVCGNHFEGAISEALGNNNAGGFSGVTLSNAQPGSCRVADNLFVDFMTAVTAGAEADGCVIENNTVIRVRLEFPEAVPVGIDAIRTYLDKRIYAIDVFSPRCEVRGNRIDLPGPAWGGVRAGASVTTIVGNLLEAEPGPPNAPLPASIYCGLLKQGKADRAEVVGNRLVGTQTGVFISRIDAATVAQNRCDAGWYGVAVDDCTNSTVRGNQVAGTVFGVFLSEGVRNRVLGNDVRECALGIVGDQDADLEIAGNRLFGCPVMGVLLRVAGSCAFLHNRVVRCAYNRGNSIGVVMLGNDLGAVSGSMLRVEDCELIDTGISPDGTQVSGGVVWGLAAWVHSCELVGNHIGYAGLEPSLSPNAEHRALRLAGPISFTLGAGIFGPLSSALISGNQLRGPGATSLVELMSLLINQTMAFRFERVTFSNNACEHWSAKPSHSATVQLRGGYSIVVGNHVKGPTQVNSIAMGGPLKGTLVGNVGTGAYVQTGGAIPMPVLNFNAVLP